MRRLFILLCISPFLFAGSTGQYSKIYGNALSPAMDTMILKRLIQRKADSVAIQTVYIIDSMFTPAKSIIGRIDLEERVNGTKYLWLWKYRVRGTDTLYDTTIIELAR